MKFATGVGAALLTSIVAAQLQSATWDRWGFDLENTRFNPSETLISPENVHQLEVKWTFTAFGEVSATPTVAGSDVFFTDWGGGVHRVDLHTGKTVWSVSLPTLLSLAGAFSRSGPLIFNSTHIILALVNNGEVLSLRILDGRLEWRTKISDNVCARMTQSPVEAEGYIYIGQSGDSFNRLRCPGYRGSIAKLDPSNGRILWQKFTIPEFRTVGPDSVIGASVWARVLSFDLKRRLVFVPTGQPHDLPQAILDCERQRLPSDPSCLPDDVLTDSIIALNIDDGSVVWQQRMTVFDDWNNDCRSNETFVYCPYPEGPDSDFGQGPIVMNLERFGEPTREWLGAGQKSGNYWMLNRDDGEVQWVTNNGADGYKGGLEFGSAFDQKRIYVAQANSENKPFKLKHSTRSLNEIIYGAHFAALDPFTGEIIWETPAPRQLNSYAYGSVTAANGLVFGGTTHPTGPMYAIEAATGKILWTFECGGSVAGGPSVSQGIVLWGCGYPDGTFSDKLFAFALPEDAIHKDKN